MTALFLLTDIECHILKHMMETKIALLENVLGFRSVLDVVIAIIRRNVPGFLCSIFHYFPHLGRNSHVRVVQNKPCLEFYHCFINVQTPRYEIACVMMDPSLGSILPQDTPLICLKYVVYISYMQWVMMYIPYQI